MTLQKVLDRMVYVEPSCRRSTSRRRDLKLKLWIWHASVAGGPASVSGQGDADFVML